MKKLNNKGFSLVELIIVIAIMAVLAGALAPALITYIEKSRISTDKQTADTIRGAIQSALADDTVYDDTIPGTGSKSIVGKFVPYTGTGTPAASDGLVITSGAVTGSKGLLKDQVDRNVKPQNVRVKSKKAWNETEYLVYITQDGDVRVFLTYGKNAKKYGANLNDCSDTMKADKPTK